MPAGKWKVYDNSKVYLANGTLDLDLTTNMQIALFASTSNANTLSVGTSVFGDLTNELATANGYTAGGQALTGEVYTQTGGVATFDCNDPVWTASGGSITARFAVIYVNATVNSIVKPLICVCLLDTTPADVTATSGNTLTIQMNASGVFTVSGATTD
jgi:hypothetical protein